jgi:large subunit ribosomal protein L25
MKVVSMSGSLRESVGKKDAKKQRVEGKVPCVIFGSGQQIHFATESSQFRDIIFTPEVCFVDISIEGKTYRTILQDVQYHPVSDNIYHADFLELMSGKAITMHIPVKLTGNSKGVIKGGKLALKMRKLAVNALPENMPETLTIDITSLDVGQSIKVRDLASEKYHLLDTPNAVVVTVAITRGAKPGGADSEEDSAS